MAHTYADARNAQEKRKRKKQHSINIFYSTHIFINSLISPNLFLEYHLWKINAHVHIGCRVLSHSPRNKNKDEFSFFFLFTCTRRRRMLTRFTHARLAGISIECGAFNQTSFNQTTTLCLKLRDICTFALKMQHPWKALEKAATVILSYMYMYIHYSALVLIPYVIKRDLIEKICALSCHGKLKSFSLVLL